MYVRAVQHSRKRRRERLARKACGKASQLEPRWPDVCRDGWVLRRRLGSDERADAVEARGAELGSGVRALERRRALHQTPGKPSQQSSLVAATLACGCWQAQ